MPEAANSTATPPAGIGLDKTDLLTEMAEYDALPPILREQLRDFPFNMKAGQLQWALANGWKLNDIYEKVIEARRAQALGYAVSADGTESYV